MSKEPIFIKCNLFITYEDMMETKKKILKQLEEDNPIIVLPYGFELAEVNVKLLEKIQERLNHRANEHLDGDYYVQIKDINEVFDEEISKLKENK